MDNLAYGINYPCAHQLVESPGEFAKRVEALGFQSVWLPDTSPLRTAGLEAISTLSFMAAQTEKILLGTSVLAVPLRQPLILLQTLTSLDILSQGRLLIGAGSGFGRLLDVFNGSLLQRGQQLEEIVQLMRQLWLERRVKFEGRFVTPYEYSLDLEPVQSPHPPVWLGAASSVGFRRAGRIGDGVIAVDVPPSRLASWSEGMTEAAESAGRDPSGLTRAVHLYSTFAETRQAGFEIASECIKARHRIRFEAAQEIDAHLVGQPGDWRASIDAFREAGVTHFILDPCCSPEQVSDLIEQAAEIIRS